MSEKLLLRLRVNREPVEVAVPVHKTLLEVLREDLRLTGTKHRCELGECAPAPCSWTGSPFFPVSRFPLSSCGRRSSPSRG